MFSACTALENGGKIDKAYNTGKVIYKAGKTVAPIIPMSDKTRDKLKTVDEYATNYDGARTVLRGSFDEKKQDANSSLEPTK